MKKNNLLDYKPILCSDVEVNLDEIERVTVKIEHKGFYAFLATKLFKKPKFTTFELDNMGSFIVSLIDGEKSLYDISLSVKERFGEEAEPLYPRLVEYVVGLRAKNIINFKK